MSYLKKAAVLFCLNASAVHADQTMQNLQGSAQAILDQLAASQDLAVGAVYSAGQGDILATGVMQDAAISDQMVANYNGALQSVLDANYYTSQMLFEDEHEEAMANLDTAVDNLVAASLVLMEVQAVANMAANADTVQEQLVAQAALETTDMSISTADVSAYNTALGAVQTYARDAGAFLAASRNTSLTGATDTFAANSGTSLYGANVAYSATADIINISAGQAFGVGFQGFLSSNVVTLDEVYAAGYGS
jgi:hypothetical protein